MATPVVLVADAGMEAGLGHISRATGVAVALRFVGFDTLCYAYGADEPLRRDGVEWAPLQRPEIPAAHVLVIDSYRLPQETLAEAGRTARLVVMHDFGGIPAGAALTVSAADPARGDGARLTGFSYAALRPGFWGLPPRDLQKSVRSILVTTGGGQFAELGEEVARALTAKVPGSEVALVAGPHANIRSSGAVELLVAPTSLLGPLLETDLVVSAAGQTMLEAAAAGTPCIALPLVENQRRQAVRLAEVGAVRLVDPPSAAGAANAAEQVARDVEVRRALSRGGQRVVDGYGALRVALAIAQLAGDAS